MTDTARQMSPIHLQEQSNWIFINTTEYISNLIVNILPAPPAMRFHHKNFDNTTIMIQSQNIHSAYKKKCIYLTAYIILFNLVFLMFYTFRPYSTDVIYLLYPYILLCYMYICIVKVQISNLITVLKTLSCIL